MPQDTASPPREYNYELGPTPIAMAGAMRPFGPRILCRAILDDDHVALSRAHKAKVMRAEAARLREAGDTAQAEELETMASAHESSGLVLVKFNALDAAAFVIEAVGRGVEHWCEKNGETPPLVGQHCDVRSVAADRVQPKDPSGRYWLVHCEDIGGVWDAPTDHTPGLVDAIEAYAATKRETHVPSASTGEAMLEPQG